MAAGAGFLLVMGEAASKGSSLNQTSRMPSGRYKLVERFDERNKG